MSLTRRFEGLASFAHFLDERVVAMVPIGRLMVAEGTRVLARETRAAYGKHDLAELAQATQDERVRLGYAPDDPLLRDGSLLRDSVEEETTANESRVGTSEPIAAYHEFGYMNVRARKAVPPRSAFRNALVRVGPAIIGLMQDATGVQLGFTPSLVSHVETHAAEYALNVEEI